MLPARNAMSKTLKLKSKAVSFPESLTSVPGMIHDLISLTFMFPFKQSDDQLFLSKGAIQNSPSPSTGKSDRSHVVL